MLTFIVLIQNVEFLSVNMKYLDIKWNILCYIVNSHVSISCYDKNNFLFITWSVFIS